MRSDTTIRWADYHDVDDVARLDLAVDSYTTPWKPAAYQEFLGNALTAGIVAQVKGEIVGFVFYVIEADKFLVRIVRMGVQRPWQRKRIGTLLLNAVHQKAKDLRELHMKALVHEANLPAQLFFKFHRFQATAVHRKSFDQGDSDGYLFTYDRRS